MTGLETAFTNISFVALPYVARAMVPSPCRPSYSSPSPNEARHTLHGYATSDDAVCSRTPTPG